MTAKVKPVLKKVEAKLRRDFMLIAALGGMIFIISSSYFFWEAARLIKDKRVQQLTTVADNFANAVIEDWVKMNLASIEEKAQTLVINNALESVMVANLDGAVLVNVDIRDGVLHIDYTEKKLDIFLQQANVLSKNGFTKIQKKIEVSGTPLGIIQLDAQVNSYNPIISRLITRLGATLGTLVFLAGIVFLVVTNRLIKVVVTTLTSLHKEGQKDKLTGLPNRNAIYDYVSNKLLLSNAYGERFTVCFIDVNNLKQVNDQFGHNVGDMLIRQVAQRLKSALRDKDFLGRLAGDEFIAVLDHTSEERGLEKVLERLLDAVNHALPTNDSTILPSCSIGAAASSIGDNDPDELINQADKAMYKAKKMHKTRGAFVIQNA
jgi:diguanylate cyclase (GGDEF)-like protein